MQRTAPLEPFDEEPDSAPAWYEAGSPQAWRERIREAFAAAQHNLRHFGFFRDMWDVAYDLGTLMDASTLRVDYSPAARRGRAAQPGTPLYRAPGLCEILPLTPKGGRDALKLLVASGFVRAERAACQGRPPTFHLVIPRGAVFDIPAILSTANALGLSPAKTSRDTSTATARRRLYAELRRGGQDPATVLGPLYPASGGPSSRSSQADRHHGPQEERQHGPLEDRPDGPPSFTGVRQTGGVEENPSGTTPGTQMPKRRAGAGGIMETVPGGRLDERPSPSWLAMRSDDRHRRARGA